jgi:phosphatidylserine decarboxylase
MAKSLKEWVEADVALAKQKPLKWIAEEFFFRDPSRPMYSDDEYFFSPADGVIIYQPCFVIGVFMTMYDVHINRLPYAGFLSYKQLDAISTFNVPMLDIEHSLVDDLAIDHGKAEYLHSNQRMINRVYTPALQQYYYVLQIADYDVDCITPFQLNQNAILSQNERFSQIRFGSQVDLILPLSERYHWEHLQQTGSHVEAGIDPLIRIVRKV